MRMIARSLAMALLMTGSASADFDPSQYPAHETCALCHGLFGVSRTDKFPNLAGQKKAYIEAQVWAFREGHRTNDGGQMVTIVSELAPEDVPNVAEWFSTQDPPAPYPNEDANAGHALYTQLSCDTCHDMTLGDEMTPHLTAQKPGYLKKQMTDFRDQRRASLVAPSAHAALSPISDSEIATLAAYLAAQVRP